MGYQSEDDGLLGRGGVTTLMSHQNGILHSLIFVLVTPGWVLSNHIFRYLLTHL